MQDDYFCKMIKWLLLTDIQQLKQVDEFSKTKKVLLFKHSTRCSISSAALGRIERNWKTENENQLLAFYLDLIRYRDISDAIAERYGVIHQSPQALIISDGKCIFSQTHSAIRLEELLSSGFV